MTTHEICAEVNEVIRLNPVDLYINTYASIPWVMFYSNDISAPKLIEALHVIAAEYPVLCGRLVTDEETRRMKLIVTQGVGFHLVEEVSDLSLLEAIMETKLTNQESVFPSYADLPFSMSNMKLFEVLDHDGPVFSLRLVHYKDGTSSFAATLHHAIADGQRLANVIVQITRAYRGESIVKVDHDRSRLWPDALLKNTDVGVSPIDYPRTCGDSFDVFETPDFPGDKFSIESVHFSKTDLDFLKRNVIENLEGDVEYVSGVDVLSALNWLLRCELKVMRNGFKGIVKTAKDLQISGTVHGFFMELISNNTTLVPSNYFGSCFIWTHARYPEIKQSENADLFSTLVEAARTIRKQILDDRSTEKHVHKILEVYKQMHEKREAPDYCNLVTSYCKMPFNEMEFGEGPPIYIYAPSAHPFHYTLGSLAPSGSNGGITLNLSILESEKQRFFNSSVLKKLFPKARFLSQMSVVEWAQFLCP